MKKSYSKAFSTRKKSNSKRKNESLPKSFLLSAKDLTWFSFVLLFTIAINNFKAQNGHSTDPFDKVSDMYGNTYNLSDISTLSPNPFGKPIGNGGNTSSYTPTCQAGYFVLHYAPNSFLATATNASTIQAVICQVFSDVSNFIISPLAIGSNTVKIHIYCDDASPSAGYLGAASGVYVYPNNPSNPNQGYLQNQIERGLQSGVDPFANLSSISLVNGANFYSGFIWINPTTTWNYAINTATQTSTEIDLYTVTLHEVMHALGFATLINYDGFSKFGSANNFFSYYDQFLNSHNLTPLLTTTNTTCSNSDITWNSTLTPSLVFGTLCSTLTNATDIPAPSNCGSNTFYSSTNNTLISVYTPTCFQTGSSLSHFEDMCSLPSGYTNSCTPTPTSPGYNNLYYVMSNANGGGDCFIKRYPKSEERFVLCDLGYSVKDVYSSTSTSVNIANNTYSYGLYPGGICAPSQTIVGNHDGIINGVYVFTTTSSSTIINIASDVLANDSPTTGLQMSCLELMYSSSASYTNNGTTITVTATAGSGLVVFRYLPKHTSSGKFGPPTYIFLYFLETTCVPATLCDHVENGTFENQISGSCGLLQFGGPVINCWNKYYNDPALFVNACNTATIYNLGGNTLNTSIPVSSYNGTINTHVVGIRYRFQSLDHESVQNNLAIPLAPPSTNSLVPTQTYQVSFWAMNKAYSSGNPDINPNNSPCVINFACNPTYPILTPTVNQPSGLNNLINFTVAAGNLWTQYTGTFVVPTSSVNQSCLVVGYNALQTLSLTSSSSGTVGQYIYTFIDDISIKPVNSVTFSIPGANNCGNVSFTNLAQYASTVPGTFSGTGVSSVTTGSLTTYNFSVSSIGTYPIAFTYTYNGCSGTVWENIVVHPPDFNISINSSSLCLNTGAPAVAQASINSSNTFVFDWQPGYLAGSTQTINSASTVYTISAQSANCILTQTFSAPTSTACCTNSFTNYSSPVLTSSLSGNNVINSNIIVPSGSSVTIYGSVLFAPNVKVTVVDGATLTIKEAHLYACSSEMWQGIEILDGGKLISHNETPNALDNLIEDAKIAVDAVNQYTSALAEILVVDHTTFNKNYIDINISNYTKTITPYPFIVYACVFSCRDLTFTSNFWPQTGTVISASTPSADLRHTFTSTATTLASPYLQQSTFTITTLKNPYSNQQSHIAINLNTVGITPGPAASTNGVASMHGLRIGSITESHFNLFDAHGSFLVANKSNVTLVNNVFQNTKTYTVSGGSFYGGTAIKHNAIYSPTDVMHTMLNMPATSESNGNRFWNCHRGIDLDKTYLFWLEYAIFRSTQSITTGTTFMPGYNGIYAPTNNFDYYIANSEFTNIRRAINIPITSGLVAPKPNWNTPPIIGIFAHRIRISNNVFFADAAGTDYMNEAVIMTSPNSTPWDIFGGQFIVPQNNSWPYTQGIIVGNNSITNAFNGVSINGSHGFQVHVFENNISLKVNSSAQYGIELKNCFPTFSTTIGKNDISNNTVSFTSSVAATNTLSSLIFCGDNGYGITSPSVSCNELSQGGRGFVFDGINQHALWGGNKMNTPMKQGFVLSHTAEIGAQGTTSTAIANEWIGGSNSWTGTTNYGTYVGNGSLKLNSKLYVRQTATTTIPQNNDSYNIGENYTFGSGYYYMTYSGGGDYNCSEFPNYKVKPPLEEDYDSDFAYHRAKDALYRFLKKNDSIRDSDIDLSAFYDDQSGSSIDKFLQIEEYLYYGYTDEATNILNDLDDSGFNTFETNYKEFYTLYLNYLTLDAGARYHSGDSSSLKVLAELCPGTNGPVVYQAIALYNSIYGELIMPECYDTGAKTVKYNTEENKNEIQENNWDLKVFPNPTSTVLNFTSNIENQDLYLSIIDLGGRIVFSGTVQTKDFMAKLELNLMNGAYFITIQNLHNEKITKKLLIAK